MTASSQARWGAHLNQPVFIGGEGLDAARAALVMLHGRGASAQDMLSLAEALAVPGIVYLAPQAAGFSWYPHRFFAPLAQNEPYLSAALAVVQGILERLAEAGIPAERAVLLGFSQGACLALEFVARNPRRYGGVVGLSGCLIGPDGVEREPPKGSLDGTPVFLGCGDADPHIPRARVEEAARVLRERGADVTLKLYAGMGHTVNEDELDFVRRMVSDLKAEPDS